MTHAQREGFTLIELSIVLVIIGLIVGGILIGKDLIHAATVRNVVTEVQQIQTAVGVFKDRYNALPGDITNPIDFFGAVCPAGNSWIHGDGDGLISGNPYGYYEQFLATCQLGEDGAKLLAGSYCADAPWGNCGGYTQPYPPSKYNANINYQFISNDQCPYSLNCFQLDAVYNGATFGTRGGAVIPADAFIIDTKLDDGLSQSGRVQANNGYLGGGNFSNDCISGTGYNEFTTSPDCVMLFNLGY